MNEPRRITILSGHFGSGKTEIAINLALAERKQHEKTAINDLDVVNPYFRTRDAEKIFEEEEVELIAPSNRLASADLPIVSGEMYRVLHDPRYRLIVDAGGDKDGAIVLSQYYHEWKDLSPELLFVLNSNRPYVSTTEGALFTIEQIEKASRLKVTAIINNTNLGRDTTITDIARGYEHSKRLSEQLNIPIKYTTISDHLKNEAEEFCKDHKVVYIRRYMKLPWEK